MVDQTSQFYAILTDVGAAKQANADALGIAWTFSQMGVGDGNPAGLDNPPLPMPNASQRALLNEWRRAPLNQLKVDPNNAAVIIAEQIIPADVGGKWIREIALYDADGDMVAVANCPPTFKPLMSQGSGRTQVLRLNLLVKSASNVQLKIDPSVVLATREWVTEELARQDFKYSVLAATTGAITLSGLQTVDGVQLTAGARVLVKNQAAAKDNGLYLVVAGGAWTRCTDADASTKVTPGMLVLVERGTANGDSAWQLVTDASITLGVTALAFEMAFGRTGVAAGTYRSVTVDAYGRVTAASNPTTVAGYGLTDVYTKTQIDQALALKAPLESPTFTGAPKLPTAPPGTNTTQGANTAFVQAAIAALVASSPAALDTLNELAAALGNDPNYAATIATALGLKAPLASPVFTGDPKAPTPAVDDDDTSLSTTEYVLRAMGIAGYGPKSTAYSIGAGVDLNTMKTGGSYGQASNGGATLALHYPVALAGTLLVLVAGTSVVTQVYTVRGTGVTYIRSYYATWSDWAPVWDGINTPKQSHPLDVTPGAMLTTGSFGLGGDSPVVAGSLDSLGVGGLYSIGSNTSAGLPDVNPPVPQGSQVLHMSYSEGSYRSETQLLIDRIYDRMFFRRCDSGSWKAWRELASDAHLPYRARLIYRTAGVYQWTVPAGVYKVDVEVRGAGGSGGFGTQEVGSGGGGGGGISKRLCNVVPGSVITITVGAGGAAVSAAGASGNAGTASAFGTFCSATGGAGGSSGSGAAGGYGAGGDINMSMGSGSPALRNAPGTYALGGAGGGGESIFATSNSTTPTQPGMGGGGRTSNQSQPGADGCVFITY